MPAKATNEAYEKPGTFRNALADMILETLAARYRLGENEWPIGTGRAFFEAAEYLQEKRLTHWRYGPTGDICVRFTTEGLAATLSPDYSPGAPRPNIERLRQVVAQLSIIGQRDLAYEVATAIEGR